MLKETEAAKSNKHSHNLTRVNIQACSTCGKFVATTYRETKKGELVIDELELDVKILSSRIGHLRTTALPHDYRRWEQPSNAVKRAEDTCW